MKNIKVTLINLYVFMWFMRHGLPIHSKMGAEHFCSEQK